VRFSPSRPSPSASCPCSLSRVRTEYSSLSGEKAKTPALFGTNVKPPHNGDPDNWHDHTDGTKAPLNWFAGILAFLILVSCCIATTVRWWRWSARVKWTKRRGEPLPSTWDGFWGFR
jgi:hypothetical protein